MSTSGSAVRFFVGTYTETLPYLQGRGPGILRLQFSAGTGRLEVQQTLPDVRNPTYLAVHPSGRYLYAANQVDHVGDAAYGSITSLAISPQGELRLLNVVSSQAPMPCHVAVSPDGRYVYAATYEQGSVTVLPVQADGSLREAAQVIRHEGVGPDPERQSEAHPHMVLPTPDGQVLYVPDLGSDEIVRYHVDPASGVLTGSGAVKTAPGSGPRHLALHPRLDVGFVVNELDSTLSCLRLQGHSSSVMQTLSTVPDDHEAPNAPAAVRTDATGRRVYVSNRGHNSIAVFAFDESSVELRALGHVPSGGTDPVDIALAGDTMLVVNQGSDQVAVFRTSSAEDAWEPVAEFSVPTPACAVAAPR